MVVQEAARRRSETDADQEEALVKAHHASPVLRRRDVSDHYFARGQHGCGAESSE